MKYQITLATGANITCDSYQQMPKGLAYQNGTLQVYMTHDMYDVNSITRVRVPKRK